MAQLNEAAAVAEAEVVETAADNSQGVEKTETEAPNEAEAFYADDQPETAEDDVQEADESDEQAEAVIAPASLKPEEKEQFAQLPPEAQRTMSEILQRRDREVQQGLETARSAQRDAQRTAADQVAVTQQQFAAQMNQLVQAFAPQPPPIDLVNEDPYEYTRQKAIFDQESAQYANLVGQITAMHGQAAGHFEARSQEWVQDQVGQLRSIPEYANDETRQKFLDDVKAVGIEIGYPEEQLSQADAQDIFALNKVRTWRSDAEKWRAHQKQRNARPRAAQGRFASAPVGNAAASNGVIGAQTSTLKALYPND